MGTSLLDKPRGERRKFGTGQYAPQGDFPHDMRVNLVDETL